MTWQIAEKKSSYAEHASAWELYCCCKLPQLGQFYYILRKRESSVSFFKPKLSLPLVAEKEKSDQVSLFFAFFLLFVPPNQAKMELRFFCDSSNTPDMTFNFRNEKEMSATVFLVFVKGGNFTNGMVGIFDPNPPPPLKIRIFSSSPPASWLCLLLY